MSRQTAGNQPPRFASLLAAQDELKALRLLLAQRRLYSRAKRWSLLRWIGFSVVGVAANLDRDRSRRGSGCGALASVWIFLSRTWFSGREQALGEKGVDVREQSRALRPYRIV
ncbi:MAG: hypothetical protein IPJ14_09650 [Kineosporiaceae bacterium]|nr:hypothetical protein [Kineosporiaceae bacterium]MBK7622910.1 hypothetical protein [Kineosporiaceae bacterium]